MSENLNNLFNESTDQDAATSSRSLAGTAQLTTISAGLAAEALKTIEDDFETYKELVAKSKIDHNAMDQLIEKAVSTATLDVKFLTELDADTIDGMLKSQQSKRSRTKGKVMTMDNYRVMMTAAFAERLIRQATGQSKNASGPRRFAGQVEFTAEQLAELNNDQEKLRKELRNVQSKKSIMKSKEGFSEEDPKWLELLEAEKQLKAVRTEPTKIVQVDDTKNKLTELLAAVADINHLKPAEAKKLLEEIKSLTAIEAAQAIASEIAE